MFSLSTACDFNKHPLYQVFFYFHVFVSVSDQLVFADIFCFATLFQTVLQYVLLLSLCFIQDYFVPCVCLSSKLVCAYSQLD